MVKECQKQPLKQVFWMSNTILIVGASSDLGLDLIKSLDEDCLILAHYNSSKEKLVELGSKISNEMVLLKADLSSEEETLELTSLIEEKYETPNKIVLLAAPSAKNIRFKDMKWSDFEQDINVSLRSSVLILSRFLPKLAKQKTGKVIFMLSSYVIGVPPTALAHYTTGKYALLGLMKSLASEYATKNIQINAVSPSMIETKFLSNLNERLVELTAYNHPLKRNACTQDVIPIVKMLLSKDSNYINGTNIKITGGSVF